jgi:hypothetical protein
MVADALASCGANLRPEDRTEYAKFFNIYFDAADDHTKNVFWHMQQAVGPKEDGALGGLVLNSWESTRSSPYTTCDATTGASGQRYTLPKRSFTVGLIADSSEQRQPVAQFHTVLGSYELCIAQTLRDFSPGAASGSTLLLSQQEQLEHLEAVRQHAQQAMLQLALIASTLVAWDYHTSYRTVEAVAAAVPEGEELPIIQRAAAQSGAKPKLKKLGADLAAAVQLHVTVSRELAELYARARDSRVQLTPTQSASNGAAQWGEGSWQQRLMAAMYGGDPLASSAASNWQSPLEDYYAAKNLSKAPAFNPGRVSTRYWPTQAMAPYFELGKMGARAWNLLELARTTSSVLLVSGTADAAGANCAPVDAAKTATRILDGVELALQKEECGCTAPTVPTGEKDRLLWKAHGIRNEDGVQLGKYLAQAVGRLDKSSGAACATVDTDWLWRPYRRPGALGLASSLKTTSDGAQLLGNAKLVDRDLAEMAQPYLALTRVLLPTAVFPEVKQSLQGFPAPDTSTGEDRRRLGAVSALQAVRSILTRARVSANKSKAGIPPTQGQEDRLDDILAFAPEAVAVIEGAIGSGGVSIVPELRPSNGTFPRVPRYQVEITSSKEDPFWLPSGDRLYVVPVPNDVYAAALASAPGKSGAPTRIMDRTLASVFRTRRNSILQMGYADQPAALVGYRWFPNEQGTIDASTQRIWTLIAWRASQAEYDAVMAGGEVDPARVKLLAGMTMLPSLVDTHYSMHFSTGGALGQYVAMQMSRDPLNPDRSAVDAFGLPRRWMPPTSAELLGGEPGQSSIPFLVGAAKENATLAAQAVKDAMDSLATVQADEATLRADTIRSQRALSDVTTKLCGVGVSACTFNVLQKPLQKAWYPSLRTWTPKGTPWCTQAYTAAKAGQSTFVSGKDAAGKDIVEDTSQGLVVCAADELILASLAQYVDLADPVEAKLNAASAGVPLFNEYAGGDLQSALVEQFRAIRALDEQFQSMLAARDAATSRLLIADKVIANAKIERKQDCNGLDRTIATYEGVMDTVDEAERAAKRGAQAGIAFGPVGVAVGTGVGFVTGSIFGGARAKRRLERMKARCNQATIELDIAVNTEVAQMFDALSAVVDRANGTVTSQGQIANSGAAILQMAQAARLEGARIALEQKLTEESLQTLSGLYRRYHSYDLWRARALVENSLRTALIARRAIEARYALDMSEMAASEPFVASPRDWADEVFEFDLSLPRAVGLLRGEGVDGGVYSNKVLDYVKNLESFMLGYSVRRPTAAGVEDVDVITLPGLSPFDGGTLSDGTEFPGARGNWSVACADPATGEQTWKPIAKTGGVEVACVDWTKCSACAEGQVACARTNGCVRRPEAARLTFTLDPWGRLNTSSQEPPYEVRHNARWSRLAVNLVGTGVRDCESAKDPMACYSSGFVRYDLVHLGPSFVTNYQGEWEPFAIPTGVVEFGKGLAQEIWLDPLKDGWGTQYISPISRSEFAHRPLSGTYELILHATPEVRLENIERIQVLQGVQYWAAQRR